MVEASVTLFNQRAFCYHTSILACLLPYLHVISGLFVSFSVDVFMNKSTWLYSMPRFEPVVCIMFTIESWLLFNLKRSHLRVFPLRVLNELMLYSISNLFGFVSWNVTVDHSKWNELYISSSQVWKGPDMRTTLQHWLKKLGRRLKRSLDPRQVSRSRPMCFSPTVVLKCEGIW